MGNLGSTNIGKKEDEETIRKNNKQIHLHKNLSTSLRTNRTCPNCFESLEYKNEAKLTNIMFTRLGLPTTHHVICTCVHVSNTVHIIVQYHGLFPQSPCGFNFKVGLRRCLQMFSLLYIVMQTLVSSVEYQACITT